jgi:hypothetical protein
LIDRDEARRSGRVLRWGVLGSILVHALSALLWILIVASVLGAHAFVLPTPPPDVVVTTSNAITIERRSHPKPAPQARPHPRAAAPQRAATQSVPKPAVQPRALVQPVVPRPPVAEPPKTRALHELAKSTPRVLINPPKTIHATPPPGPEPTQPGKERTEPQPQHVALAERPAQRPANPSNPARLSQAQLAHIGSDISKELAQLRAESNPLAVHSTAAPSAERRYHVQMIGIPGDMRHAQGSCYPIKAWVQGAYDYYYESCDVQFDDGHYETQAVPWPIRYPIGRDLYHGDLGRDTTVPLPPPLPGWKLPAGERVSDELRAYAREHGVEI